MIPKITQQKLDVTAQKFATQLLADVKAVFESDGYKATGELADSPVVKVTQATDSEPPMIILTYADQGFFIGYKNPQWTKLPNIDKLMEWVQSSKIDFGQIPGYSSGRASNLTEEQRNSRIAWAIAKNKRKEDTWKPKRWKRAANLGDLLKKLNEETLILYKKDTQKILNDAIEKGTVVS